MSQLISQKQVHRSIAAIIFVLAVAGCSEAATSSSASGNGNPPQPQSDTESVGVPVSSTTTEPSGDSTESTSSSPPTTEASTFQPPESLSPRNIEEAYERTISGATFLTVRRVTLNGDARNGERVAVEAQRVDGEWIGHASFEGLNTILQARAANNEVLGTLLLAEGVSFATVGDATHVERDLAVAWGVGVEPEGSEFVAIRASDLNPQERFVLGLFVETELDIEIAEGESRTLELRFKGRSGSLYEREDADGRAVIGLDSLGALRSVFADTPVSFGPVQSNLLTEISYSSSSVEATTGAQPDDEDVTDSFKQYVKSRVGSVVDVPQ